jgi:hypothetical protein
MIASIKGVSCEDKYEYSMVEGKTLMILCHEIFYICFFKQMSQCRLLIHKTVRIRR